MRSCVRRGSASRGTGAPWAARRRQRYALSACAWTIGRRLRLWNFLLTEEDRLHQACAAGKRLVGAIKDLGTVPVMAYSLPNLVAFCPDGAWWLPCIMGRNTKLLEIADALGIDDSFCPVARDAGGLCRRTPFPKPSLLTCSVGAVCDDCSAIAQRLAGLGFSVLWWEVPHRRRPGPARKSDFAARRLRGPRVPGGAGESRFGEGLDDHTQRLPTWGPRMEGQPVLQYNGPYDLATGVRTRPPTILSGRTTTRILLKRERYLPITFRLPHREAITIYGCPILTCIKKAPIPIRRLIWTI